MKVSVVVPVYNPGRYIVDLVDSLRAQTLDHAEWEAVFIDDGSTDGTAEVLDRFAAETPNLRVLHTANSGWPGRPRNIGIGTAQGDYVFLSDHDDRLYPEALERLSGFAVEHAADVVIGKMVGIGRSVPDRIFARTLVDAQQDPALLMTSLTPHKLFRRAFLAEQDIRFPEGVRRLEDHLFVTKAYLRARRVSVYAERPVYEFVLRDDGGNASRRPIEWRGYFRNAAESILVVDAEAPDETTRVAMRQRWLRTEAVSRLRGRRLLTTRDRESLIAGARELLQQHYPLDEIDALSTGDRVAARLLLDGPDADLIAFAKWEASAAIVPQVVGAGWAAGGRELEVRVRATRRATAPLPSVLVDPPAGYPVGAEIERIIALPNATRIELRVDRGGAAEAIPARVEQSVEGAALQATGRFDLAALAAPGEARWLLSASVRGIGRIRAEQVRVPPDAEAGIATAAIRVRGARLRLSVASGRRLLVRVERLGFLPTCRRAASGALRIVRDPRRAAATIRNRLHRTPSGLTDPAGSRGASTTRDAPFG